jgi:hypothetical protein
MPSAAVLVVEIFACILFLTALGYLVTGDVRDNRWCKAQGYTEAKTIEGVKRCVTVTVGPEVKR